MNRNVFVLLSTLCFPPVVRADSLDVALAKASKKSSSSTVSDKKRKRSKRKVKMIELQCETDFECETLKPVQRTL